MIGTAASGTTIIVSNIVKLERKTFILHVRQISLHHICNFERFDEGNWIGPTQDR